MQPFEIMISESQERMCAIVEPARLDAVIEACARWDLDAHRDRRGHRRRRPARAARRRGGRRDPGRHAGRRRAPLRGRAHAAGPAGRRSRSTFAPVTDDRGRRCARCSAAPNIASRRWVYQQYDQLVGSGTVGAARRRRRRGAADAVAARDRGLARRQRPAHLARSAPRRRRAPSARRRATSPAPARGRPRSRTASTSATPRRGEVGYELAEAIEGMALACEALGLPVVSGNVSLYNEHFGQADLPDAGGRRRRRAGRRRAGRRGRLAGARATWCCWPATARPRWTAPSTRSWCWARWPAASPSPTWRRARALHGSWPTARRAAAAAKRARRRRRRPRGGAGRVARSPGGIGVRRRLRRSPSARAAARVGDQRSPSRTSKRWPRWPARCRCGRSARSAATPIVLSGQTLPLAEAAGTYESALPAAVRAAADVRRLRHLRPARRARPRRRAADLLRPVRAAAPRPGERRHRRVRRRPCGRA